MLDVYEACDMPPPLNMLNPYRTDGKEGMKFYTDPDYFFELWKEKMLEGGEKQRVDRARKPGRSRASSENRAAKAPRQPQNHLDQMRAKTMGNDGGYGPTVSPPGPANPNVHSGYPYSGDQYGMVHGLHASANYDAGKFGTIRSQPRPGKLDLFPPPYDSLHPDAMEETVHMVDYRAPGGGQFASAVHSPPPAVSEAAVVKSNTRGTPTRPNQPPPAPPSTGSGTLSTRSTPTSGGKDAFPPPPPEMQAGSRHSPTPPPSHDFPPPPGMESDLRRHSPPKGGPAPPPPPPPPTGFMGGASSKPPMSAGDNSARQKSAEPAAPSSSSRTPAPVKVNNTMVDQQSRLLEAIRGGITLRKVEQRNEQQSRQAVVGAGMLHNVAEIIARRKAMQHSDSDTSSETEADSEWGDDIH
ncbi:putative Wiskott-Aldrich syndrome protein family member 3 [Hypsibius exemplaris]|nr:putative Wiskott-Aldrich syndrome protein family member 3 [Hypsibius exemplaris]